MPSQRWCGATLKLAQIVFDILSGDRPLAGAILIPEHAVANAGMANMPTGMPALSDGSGSGPRVLEPDEAFPSTAENDPHFDSLHDSHTDGHQHAYGLGPHYDTKTKRNAKQQMQNKQAQQRYRERRKQRFTEMESQVKGLTNQLQDQASLRRQNNALMVRSDSATAYCSQAETRIVHAHNISSCTRPDLPV